MLCVNLMIFRHVLIGQVLVALAECPVILTNFRCVVVCCLIFRMFKKTFFTKVVHHHVMHVREFFIAKLSLDIAQFCSPYMFVLKFPDMNIIVIV